MTYRLGIFGAGGFGREVFTYCNDLPTTQQPTAISFIEDAPSKTRVCSHRVIALQEADPADFDSVIIAIGEPSARPRIADALASRGFTSLPFVHPLAYVAPTAVLGAGVFVGPFASVGNDAHLHAHVAMNIYSSAGHDAEIGSGSILSPYATLNGGATLGRGVFMGTHATVTPRQSIGDGSKVAAGAVVTRSVAPGRIAIGNPAKPFPLLGR